MKFGLFNKDTKRTEQKAEQLKDKKEAEIREGFSGFSKDYLETKNPEVKNPFEEQSFSLTNQRGEKKEEMDLKEIQQKLQSMTINPYLNPDVKKELENQGEIQESKYKSDYKGGETSANPLFSDAIIPPPTPPLKFTESPKPYNDREQEFGFKDYSILHRVEPLILKPEEESFERVVTSEKPRIRELFLNINNYKEILQEMKNLKIILESTNYYLDDAEEEDKKEEKVINEVKSRLEDVERKILLIDKILFEK